MVVTKILWAIDIYENHPKALKASVDFLEALSKVITFKVDVVSVLYGEKNDSINVKEQYRKKLKVMLGDIPQKEWFGKEVILIERQIPQKAAVLRLLNFARRQNYDAFIIIKHSQKLPSINYLGSFAEMTAFLSEIPLFLINPDGIIPGKIEKILLPIGESDKSEKNFKSLFRFLPLEGKQAKLFHRIAVPFYFRSKEYISQFILDQKNMLKRSFGIIELMGKQSGGKVEIDIKRKSQDLDVAIIEEGRKGNFDLIEIMHTKKGSLGFFLGKTTKKILQNADRPVLLFRP